MQNIENATKFHENEVENLKSTKGINSKFLTRTKPEQFFFLSFLSLSFFLFFLFFFSYFLSPSLPFSLLLLSPDLHPFPTDPMSTRPPPASPRHRRPILAWPNYLPARLTRNASLACDLRTACLLTTPRLAPRTIDLARPVCAQLDPSRYSPNHARHAR